MKCKLYILISLLVFLTSCTQEWLTIGEQTSSENTSYLGNDEYQINTLLEGADLRTRTVDFSETGSIRINQVWIGVFGKNSGKKYASSIKTMDYKTIETGKIHEGLIRITLRPEDNERPTEECIAVCLANYSNVNDEKGFELEERLSLVKTWREFNEIAVDAKTAYSNMHDGIVPVLAGFLYKVDRDNNNNIIDSDETHIKIDQFEEFNNPSKQGVLLSPAYRANDLDVGLDADGNFNFTGHLLKLRRLIANVKVNINLTEEAKKHLILTDVSYKRYNMPRAVYIIERRLTNWTIGDDGSYEAGDFADYEHPEQSPNFSDLDPKKYYYSDDTWQYGNTTGFSFQHFANKHWARNVPDLNQIEDLSDEDKNKLKENDSDLSEEQIKEYAKLKKILSYREECSKYRTDENGENLYYYHPLVDKRLRIGDINPELYGEEDFNNYASYFVIKMHLIDKASGKGLEAEYTIHEGYTSDHLGNAIDEERLANLSEEAREELELERARDYSVARNINYTYNVTIAGVDNIYHNVNTEGAHTNGQGGKIWQFHYFNDYLDPEGHSTTGDQRNGSGTLSCSYNDMNGLFTNEISHEGGYFKNAIIITNQEPDLAFRLYGYSEEYDRIDGYNYNFPQETFSNLNQLWPPSAGATSHYFAGYNELKNQGEKEIPEELLNGLEIIDPVTKRSMNVIDFIYEWTKRADYTLPEVPKRYDVRIKQSSLDPKEGKQPTIKSTEKNDYVRAIYIADRKGTPDSKDGCTRLVKIFAGAQYPDVIQVEEEVPQLVKPSMDDVNLQYNYNILKPTIEGVEIPILRQAMIQNTDQYNYKLYIKNPNNGESIDISEYGKLNNNKTHWVYSIPMHKFPWVSADLYLNVVPAPGYENKFIESGKIKVGSITLKDHAKWYNTEPEWLGLLNNYTTPNNEQNKGEYLRFYVKNKNTKNFKRDEDTNKVYYLKTDGGDNTIDLIIYKPCEIKVTARTQNNGSTTKRRVDISVNGVTTQHVLDVTPNATSGSGPWTTVTQQIKNVDLSVKKDYFDQEVAGTIIQINPGGGGIDIQSIEIKPL